MSGRALALRYTGFAVLAVLANLAVQRGVLALMPAPRGLVPALAAGTVAGLVLKYLLDKRWVFADRATGLAAHGRRFGRYTGTGVLTTAIFWGSESGAYALWGSDLAREGGAVVGLALGYVLKYRLDRRFVFTGAEGVA